MDNFEKSEIRGDVRPADNGIYSSGNANSKQSHGDGALSVVVAGKLLANDRNTRKLIESISVAATKKLRANDRKFVDIHFCLHVVAAGKLRRLQ